MNTTVCATSDTNSAWEDIDFTKVETSVKKLQAGITTAFAKGDSAKAGWLQHKLIHSFYAKAFAVKIVTSNKGKNTPGVDGVVWKTSEEKFNAILDLNRRGYSPKPLREVYIPKPDGTMRKLGIPTMKDRAMQTLYKFTLEPIAEYTADKHSYGYRKGKCTRDAIMECYDIVRSIPIRNWILQTDIEKCFDNISHEWIMNNIPMDKVMLRKFLDNGYLSSNTVYYNDSGIPQGSCLSSVICNMVLDGLEEKIRGYCSNVDFVRYADDFLVFGYTRKDVLDCIPNVIEPFLTERGLKLSKEKTYISHIDGGFDYLGWNVKNNYFGIDITPSEYNIKSLVEKIESVVSSHICDNALAVCCKLREIINGWFNYHRGVVHEYILQEAEADVCSILWKYNVNPHVVAFVEDLF